MINIVTLLFDIFLLFLCSLLTAKSGILSIDYQDFYYAYFLKCGIFICLFLRSNLHKSVYRYFGWNFFSKLIKILFLYFLLAYFGLILVRIEGGLIPLFFETILFFNMLALSRFIFSATIINYFHVDEAIVPGRRVLIYGAGEAGIQLAATFVNKSEYILVGYIDDNLKLIGKLLNGYPIFNPNDLSKLVKEKFMDEIFMAVPSADELSYKKIIHNLSSLCLPIKTLPKLNQLPNGKVQFGLVKQVEVEDLLLREPVPPIMDLMRKDIFKQVVVVTGAGGSIGSELCRKILAQSPSKLILIDHSEFNLYKIFDEVKNSFDSKIEIVPMLTTILDKDLLIKIFEKWLPDVVYHAAAYKHVSLVEGNLISGVRNNIWGTLNLIDVAISVNCKKFILVSTDKAVRPTSVMGVTKRIAELILQAKHSQIVSQNHKQFSILLTMVRFGNVLGSSGSVVPLFQHQILTGGPVTVSHPEVVRYFMTVSEAAQLVIQAGAIASGGDVFLLDMGQPIKIIDLARKLIEISGLAIKDQSNPHGDIEIKISNLLPGEKLFEEMLISSQLETSEHPKIFRGDENFLSWELLEGKLRTLEMACNKSDYEAIRRVLIELVPEYTGKDLADYLYGYIR